MYLIRCKQSHWGWHYWHCKCKACFPHWNKAEIPRILLPGMESTCCTHWTLQHQQTFQLSRRCRQTHWQMPRRFRVRMELTAHTPQQHSCRFQLDTPCMKGFQAGWLPTRWCSLDTQQPANWVGKFQVDRTGTAHCHWLKSRFLAGRLHRRSAPSCLGNSQQNNLCILHNQCWHWNRCLQGIHHRQRPAHLKSCLHCNFCMWWNC